MPTDTPDPNELNAFVQRGKTRQDVPAVELRTIAQRMDTLANESKLEDAGERAAADVEMKRLGVRAARVIAKHDPKLPHPYGPHEDNAECWWYSWMCMCFALANSHKDKLGSANEFAAPFVQVLEDNRDKFKEWPPTKLQPGPTLICSVALGYPTDTAVQVCARIRDYAQACRLFAGMIEEETGALQSAGASTVDWLRAVADKLDNLHSRMKADRDYPGRTDEIESAMRGWKDFIPWCERHRGEVYAAAVRKQFDAVWKQVCNYGVVCGETLDAPGIVDWQNGKPVRVDNRRADRWTQQTMLADMLPRLAKYMRELAIEVGQAEAATGGGGAPVEEDLKIWKTAPWFKQETGIDAAKLRMAASAKRQKLPKRGQGKQTEYHVPTARRLWPEDFAGLESKPNP